MTKIFYACPDVAAPSGGVHTLYRHVGILREAGFDASILHTQMFFRANWFACPSVDIRHMANGDRPGPGDHLVIPEGMPSYMRDFSGTAVKRTVFAQNWAFVFDALGVGESYRQWGIRHVMCVSEYIRDLVKRTMQLDSEIVHPGVPLPDVVDRARKKRQVAYMPRKNAGDALRARKVFAALRPSNVSVDFVAVDGMRHEAVYARLLESAVFLATGYPEGCPLPPLEAMACGCIVVGFDGMGMREYVKTGINGYCVADGDAVTAAGLLDQSLQMWDSDGADSVVLAARETAAEYSLLAERDAVVDYWRRRVSNETA